MAPVETSCRSVTILSPDSKCELKPDRFFLGFSQLFRFGLTRTGEFCRCAQKPLPRCVLMVPLPSNGVEHVVDCPNVLFSIMVHAEATATFVLDGA